MSVFPQVLFGKECLYQRQFLCFLQQIDALCDAVGRFRYGNFDFGRIGQHVARQFFDIARECGRKHECLSLFWQVADYFDDVVVEPDVEHAVGFVEYQAIDTAQVGFAVAQ